MMKWCLSLGALVAALLLESGMAVAQRLSVNPYQGLGFGVTAHTDLCKVGTSGVDADARHTADHVAEAPGSPPELELNNCHLHAVSDSFGVSWTTTSPCHPDHEPPAGNCGRDPAEWCRNSAACEADECGQTDCQSVSCSVVATTQEVLAPSWTYTFPLDAMNSHELALDATILVKSLRGNCQCNTYSTAACPTGCAGQLPGDVQEQNGAPCLDNLPGLDNWGDGWTSEQAPPGTY